MDDVAVRRVREFVGGAWFSPFDKRLSASLSGSIDFAPWSGSPWPSHTDGINRRWRSSADPSPAEKYATAFGLDVREFEDRMSAVGGVDSFPNAIACSRLDRSCPSDFVCGVRRGHTEGRCVPRSAGLHDAWARASVEVVIPPCPVVMNGVTFYPEDLQALVMQYYAISNRLTTKDFDVRDTMRFGREMINFPSTCSLTNGTDDTGDAGCRVITPAVFHDVLLGAVTAPLLVRFSSQSYFVPVVRYWILEHRSMSIEVAIKEFGYAIRRDPAITAASAIKLEMHWVNLSLDREEAEEAAVMRTTISYVVEVWYGRFSLFGGWISAESGPEPTVPVSLELALPFILEENPAIGLTTQRLEQLLLNQVPCPSPASPAVERHCNPVPFNVALARSAEAVKRCEAATG
ncbi:hypothetical protein P43SY_011301 [Pythium insidiosum]|uniref:Uncharacterized protein n=1 Tax=Pythium insidiosum TaxID=114742 RepID=A0AAD5Q3J4_PYTIN|nr:hypothetical protein P43SY_011301 [Pythium insidiosum]